INNIFYTFILKELFFKKVSKAFIFNNKTKRGKRDY
ncbi:hypothetical protein FPSE_07759, partial [Fusarium pseudograminearum CS3096]